MLAVSKYIEAYNEDGGVAGLSDEGLLENSLRYFKKNLKRKPTRPRNSHVAKNNRNFKRQYSIRQ